MGIEIEDRCKGDGRMNEEQKEQYLIDCKEFSKKLTKMIIKQVDNENKSSLVIISSMLTVLCEVALSSGINKQNVLDGFEYTWEANEGRILSKLAMLEG